MFLNFNFIYIKHLNFFIIYYILMDVINQITTFLNNGLEYMNNNKYLSSVLGLFLVLYAALAAPKLPKSVTVWFDNTWFKLGFMFLIAYMATKDPSVAIISAVALLITLQTLSAQKTADALVNSVSNTVQSNLDSTVQAKVQLIKEKFTQELEEKEALADANMEAMRQAYEEDIKQIQEEAQQIVQTTVENLENLENSNPSMDDENMEDETIELFSEEENSNDLQEQEMDQPVSNKKTRFAPMAQEMSQEMSQGMSQEMSQEMSQGMSQGMASENNDVVFEIPAEVMAKAIDETARRSEVVSRSENNLCSGSAADELAGFDGFELAGATF